MDHYGLMPTPAWDFLTIERADKTHMHAAIALDVAGERLLANVFWTTPFNAKERDDADYALADDDLIFFVSFYGRARCAPYLHLGGEYVAWQEAKAHTPLLTDLIPLLACLTDCITGGEALDTCFTATERIKWPEAA